MILKTNHLIVSNRIYELIHWNEKDIPKLFVDNFGDCVLSLTRFAQLNGCVHNTHKQYSYWKNNTILNTELSYCHAI